MPLHQSADCFQRGQKLGVALPQTAGAAQLMQACAANGLAGWYVNPDVTQRREYYIVASTLTGRPTQA